MKLVVIIPSYNEEKTIGSVIKKIPQKIDGIIEIETIVVNDGSKDRTAKVAKANGAYVASHSINRGVGVAFDTGIKTALKKGADIVVNIDADGQFNPKDIPTLIQPILEDKTDFVTCSRFKDPKLVPKMPKVKIWGNKQMARFISFLIQKKFYDVSCGFRAFSKEALLYLNLFGKFTYTQECFLDLANKGLRITEIPLKIRGERRFGESKVAKNVFSYAFKTLKIIFRSIRDYKPLNFFGALGCGTILLGLILDSVVIINKVITGTYSPYKAYGFAGLFLNGLGVVILILALVADMLDRIRLNQEKILYYEKKREYEYQKRNSCDNRD